MENWLEIPDDIIDLFVKKLSPCVEELARFSSVCKSWRESALNRQKHIVHCAPWLMLAKEDDDKMVCEGKEEEGIRSFYSVSSERVFNLKCPIKGSRCWGTPYGWVVTMGLDLNINLVNPLSGSKISLPSQLMFEHQYRSYAPPYKLCKNFVRKFIIKLNSNDDQFPMVMAIHGESRTLAFATPKDKSWVSLEGTDAHWTAEVIYFKDHFYALDGEGNLRVCDINVTPPTAKEIASHPDRVNSTEHTYYLVEISGDLYLIARIYKDENYNDSGDGLKKCKIIELSYLLYETDYFLVFKFDFHTTMWTEVEDVGEHALFLGNNASFCISTLDYPEFKSNCIYFTDDNQDIYESGYCDMGIYDIKEDTVEPLYVDEDKVSQFSRPIFFIPTSP